MLHKRVRKFTPQLGIAQWIRDAVTIHAAAVYMRDCGWSIEATLFNLLRARMRDH